MLIGYARVSTTEQDTSLQVKALKRYGVKKIYQEKTSSVGKRPQLHILLNQLKEGDVLVVYKIDRIARSLKNLLVILERLKERNVGFVSLTEPIDTSTPAGLLMLQMLGAVAEFERSLITERSVAGQRLAMERGVHCGRSRSMSASLEKKIVDLYKTGNYSMRELSISYGVHQSSVKRAVYRVYKPNSSSLS